MTFYVENESGMEFDFSEKELAGQVCLGTYSGKGCTVCPCLG